MKTVAKKIRAMNFFSLKSPTPHPIKRTTSQLNRTTHHRQTTIIPVLKKPIGHTLHCPANHHALMV